MPAKGSNCELNLVDNDADADPEVILSPAVRKQIFAASAEENRIVIKLECTNINSGMDLYIQASAEHHRKAVLRLGDRRVDPIAEAVTGAIQPLIRDACENMCEWL